MAARPEKWPQTNNELLPNVLFRLAAQYPNITYAVYPYSGNVEDGFRHITFKEVANAVHAMAWWLDQHVGKPAQADGSQTLVYMGPNDLRYGMLVLSSVMVGYKMLFPTPRYGVEAIDRLVSLANGSAMLSPSDPDPVVSEVIASRSMRSLDIPSVEHFLASTPDLYPYTKTFATSQDEPLVCLHTSGTTGFPKPIIWTHDWADSIAKSHYLPIPSGYEIPGDDMFGSNNTIMSLFPRMHGSGVITSLVFPLCLGVTMVHPPSRVAPNDALDAALESIDFIGKDVTIDALAVPPPHLMYLSANPGMQERLRKQVRSVGWSGGGVPDAVGNAVAAHLHIHNFLASTEMGIWPTIQKSNAVNDAESLHNEFQYFTFHPALNIRFDALSEGDEGTLYEATVVKNEGEGAWVQPIFKIHTNVTETSLGDMFVRHPHDSNKWKHAGRSDDMLTFLNTLNYYPGAAERQLAALPGVAEAIIVGTGRPKASLLVRLEDGADLKSMWDAVKKVTQGAPVFARIARHMILEVKAPFPKTPKGSIQRKETLKMYAKDLDVLYETEGDFA